MTSVRFVRRMQGVVVLVSCRSTSSASSVVNAGPREDFCKPHIFCRAVGAASYSLPPAR
ncbi:hypothetical protein PR003_g18380 [Phytophthora rubi]|uniref:Uncharacterized protein n=1 Tax=Phytophthora rubi TaxID=129364 RepID=A0A6A3LF67_9STRA|nr:hypothetical protein PR001_g15945 [Phytophthora rubi]KAE9016718.1 hypothetical protein PR002_g13591 [Phytophthora rubi]KAE9317852.1 hypothetical protein PR003_g18380 [Phytophthora rubi]